MMTTFHDYLQTKNSKICEPFQPEPDNTHTPSFSVYTPYVTVLCQYQLFLLKGKDCNSFLQGQLCGDVREVSPTQAQITAHCTPKGRVYASLTLTKQGDDWLAIVPKSNSQALLERLQKYILFSKLTIEEVSAKHILIECTGPETAHALKTYCEHLPENSLASISTPKMSVIRQPGDAPRWLLCIQDDETAINVWERLSASHTPAHSSMHDTHTMLAGCVPVGAALQERFLPQMIKLQHFGGLSFNKGCYVGQEIIARTAHLGKIKKDLYCCSVPATEQIAVGVDIVNETGSVLGTCVGIESTHSAKDKYSLLAVITNRGLEEPLFCADQPISNIEKRFS